MTWTGSMIFIATPITLGAIMCAQRVITTQVRRVVGNGPKSGFAFIQALNLGAGFMWGMLLLISVYSLTGLPCNPFVTPYPVVGGVIAIVLMMLPIMVLTLHEGGFTSKTQFVRFSVVLCLVLGVGIPTGLQQATTKHRPGVGLHLNDALAGAELFADMVNSCDDGDSSNVCNAKMTDVVHRASTDAQASTDDQ